MKSTDVAEIYVFIVKVEEYSSKLVMKQVESKDLLGLLFNHEGGSDMFSRNVG
jgi:hypothetical protein